MFLWTTCRKMFQRFLVFFFAHARPRAYKSNSPRALRGECRIYAKPRIYPLSMLVRATPWKNPWEISWQRVCGVRNVGTICKPVAVRNIPKLNGKRLFGTRPRTFVRACTYERARPATPKTPHGIPELVAEFRAVSFGRSLSPRDFSAFGHTTRRCFGPCDRIYI